MTENSNTPSQHRNALNARRLTLLASVDRLSRTRGLACRVRGTITVNCIAGWWQLCVGVAWTCRKSSRINVLLAVFSAT